MWKGINYTDVCKIEKDQLEAKFTEDVRREMLEKIKRRQQAPQTKVGVRAAVEFAGGALPNKQHDLRASDATDNGFNSQNQQNLFNDDDFLDLL